MGRISTTIVKLTIYLTALIVYSFGAVLSYHDSIRNSWRLYFYGLLVSNIGAILWLCIVKLSKSKEDIYVSGLIWDTIMIGAFIIIPALFFDIKFTPNMVLGVILAIFAIVLMKV